MIDIDGIQKNTDFMNIFKNELEVLKSNINNTVDSIIDNYNLNILDFQTMINTNTFQVKIIDFSLSRNIPDREKEKLKLVLK